MAASGPRASIYSAKLSREGQAFPAVPGSKGGAGAEKISRPTHGNTAPREEAPGKPRWFFGLYLNMEITIALNPGDPLRGMWGKIVGGSRPGWRTRPHALCCCCARIIVSRLPLMIPAMPMASSSGYQAPPGKERGNSKARVHNGPKKTAPPRRIGPEQRRIE